MNLQFLYFFLPICSLQVIKARARTHKHVYMNMCIVRLLSVRQNVTNYIDFKFKYLTFQIYSTYPSPISCKKQFSIFVRQNVLALFHKHSVKWSAY